VVSAADDDHDHDVPRLRQNSKENKEKIREMQVIRDHHACGPQTQRCVTSTERKQTVLHHTARKAQQQQQRARERERG
jgi:hypothetical protein